MSKSLKEQYASSALFGSNATAVEAMYERYLEDPQLPVDGFIEQTHELHQALDPLVVAELHEVVAARHQRDSLMIAGTK